jgi:SHS family lactate transporter-like MFS transporter
MSQTQPNIARAPGKGAGAALTAGFLGWMLDAFDYFLVVMCLTDIGRDFAKTDAQIATSLALTLAFRPIGALIFGLIADRYGRRIPLMIDLVFYSIIEVLTGLTHNFTTFLILRALFGIGMGGEWGVGATLTMEKVPPKFRGFLSGLLQEGYAAGYLLAAVAYGLVVPKFGWRPLFFIGGLPALLALFVRMGVPESEVWHRAKSANWKELALGIARHWRTFLYLVLLMTLMNLSSHGTQDLYPTFLKRARAVSDRDKSILSALAMVGAILGGLCFGHFSDRAGRRKAMVYAFIGAILFVPLWAFPWRLSLLAAGAIAIQFMVQGAWGIIPAHICELAPDSIRGFMPGFAYQCGNLFAAYIVVFETHLADYWKNYSKALAVSASAIFIAAAIVTALGWEKRGITFGDSQDNPAKRLPAN